MTEHLAQGDGAPREKRVVYCGIDLTTSAPTRAPRSRRSAGGSPDSAPATGVPVCKPRPTSIPSATYRERPSEEDTGDAWWSGSDDADISEYVTN